MQDIDVPFYVWNRFRPNNLFVKEELLGTKHEFTFENSLVRIVFPCLSDHKAVDPDAKVTSWQREGMVGGELKPSFYSIQCLYIDVDQNQIAKLDKDVISRNANSYDLVSDAKQKELNRIAIEGAKIANRFFSKFSALARWVTDDPTICRPVIIGQNNEWKPRLFSKETGKTIWIAPCDFIVIGAEPVIKMGCWNKICDLLIKDIDVPIYIELINDARYQLNLGDIKRFISDLAVATETYIRYIVSSALPDNLASTYVTIIDEYNIRPTLTKVLPSILNDDEKAKFKKITSNLHSLFDTRNMLFHSGKLDSVDIPKCEQYLKSVRTFVEIRGLIP